MNGTMDSLEVSGAYGATVKAFFGIIDQGNTAIIEVAETSGFKSIKGPLRSPRESITKGLGELIMHGITAGVKHFIICLGGSATVDGGLGMLQELGLACYDRSEKLLQANACNFHEVVRLDITALRELTMNLQFTVLCDVENKLLGSQGAATVFGPQKGASEQDVIALEKFLTQFDTLTEKALNKSMAQVIGGGAAGGLGAAFHTYLEAKMEKGAAYFCELTGFGGFLEKADLLITGEGSIDEQSLEGKAPVVVAQLALDRNIPVIGLAGGIPLSISPDLQRYFSMLLAIGNKPVALEEAISHTKANLTRTATQIANLLCTSNK